MEVGILGNKGFRFDIEAECLFGNKRDKKQIREYDDFK